MGFFSFKKNKSLEDFNFSGGRPSRQAPPNEKGWYRFLNKTNSEKKYDYAGKTSDLKRRQNEHIRTGKLDKDKHIFEWKSFKKDFPYGKLSQKEYQKIKQYKNPPLNKNIGGGGRPPNRQSQTSLLSVGFKIVSSILKGLSKK